MFNMPMFENVNVIEETGNPFLVTTKELPAAAPGAARVEERRGQIGRSRRACAGGVGELFLVLKHAGLSSHVCTTTL